MFEGSEGKFSVGDSEPDASVIFMPSARLDFLPQRNTITLPCSLILHEYPRKDALGMSVSAYYASRWEMHLSFLWDSFFQLSLH